MDFSRLVNRMIRAAKLDSALYEEVEHDPDATMQAGTVVVLVSALAGIGALLTGGIRGFVGGILMTLIGWVVWSFLTYLVGTQLFGGKADVHEMLRVLGFAYTPMALAIIPIAGGIVAFFWLIATGVVAVRQGLDVTTGKAVATILVALVGWILVAFVFGLLFASARFVTGV